MTEIPSSSGIGLPLVKPHRKSTVKKDEFYDLKDKNASKDKTIEELIKENLRLKLETTDLALYKQQNGELKDREEQYKHRIEELTFGKNLRDSPRKLLLISDDLPRINLPFTSPKKLPEVVCDGERESGGFFVQGRTKGDGGLLQGTTTESTKENQDLAKKFQLEWSFGSGEFEPSNLNDVTLRTGLLEKIYEMARNSDAFRIQLVDNIIIFLKSKELAIDDMAVKKSLQESICHFTENRNGLQHKLEQEFDDLEERVANCFAGIAEFNDFRKYFTEELEEIKKLNDLELDSPEEGKFSPLIASSPLRNEQSVARKSSMKSAGPVNISRVRFDRRSTLSKNSKLSDSPDGDSCKDCARYRALLRSFRTTQEADLQKQKEQEKTIEKLSTAITTSARTRFFDSSTLSRTRRSGLMDIGRLRESSFESSDFDTTARRLMFDSPSGLGLKQKEPASGESVRSRVLFVSTGTITDKPRLVDYANQTSPAEKMSGFVHLSKSAEKDNRVDIVFYQNQISGLEHEIRKLRSCHVGDSSVEASTELFRLTQELDEKTSELQEARTQVMELRKKMVGWKALDEACEKAMKHIEETDAENETLKNEIQRLHQAQESHNTTQDTSVGGVYTNPPAPESPYRVENCQSCMDYQQLEIDFNTLYVEAGKVHADNQRLEERLKELSRNQSHQAAQSQRTIEELKITNSSLQTQINEVSKERNKLKNDVATASQELGNLQRELGILKNSQKNSQNSQQNFLSAEVARLRTEVQSFQDQIKTLELEKTRLADSRSRMDQVDIAALQTQDNDIRLLRNTIAELQTKIARDEIKMEELSENVNSLRDAGNEISRERFVLKGELLDETRKAKELSDKLEKTSRTVSQLNESIIQKDQRIVELESRVEEQVKLLSKAQRMFDQSQNKSFLSKLHLPWSKTKSDAEAVQGKKYAPRRSKTFAPADTYSSQQATLTLPRVVKGTQETSVSCTVVDGRNNTLPATMSSSSRVVDSISKVKFETRPSPQKSLVAIREPYLAAQHSHSMKKTLLIFSQKCSICLGDVPGVHYALRCSVCKHFYHKRCADAVQTECANVTALDLAATKQRLSLNSGRISSGSDAAEPKMAGPLFFTSNLDEPFKPVYVTLVDESLMVYQEQPKTKEAKAAPLEVIDLNEHRRQADVTCEKIPRDIFHRGFLEWDMVNMFSIKVDMGNADQIRSWYFRAPDILAKSSWTEAVGHVLMETEVDHADVTESHFLNKPLLNLEKHKDLEVSSAVFFDQYLLLGTDQGLFIHTQHKDSDLMAVEGCGGEPVLRLTKLSPTGELLIIVGNDLSLKKADLRPLKEWIHSDIPKLNFRPFADVKNCHLFESSGVNLAVATHDAINIYMYRRKDQCYGLLQSIRVDKILDSSQRADSLAGDVLTKSLLFCQEGLVVGLDQYYVLDLKTFQPREFLDRDDLSLAHWMEDDRIAEYGATSTPMGAFALPNADAHTKIRNACDREYLLCFYEGGVFVDGNGRKTRSREISWKRLPLSIHYMNNFIHVIHYNSIQVRKVMSAEDDSGISPPFFTQMNEPRYVGMGQTDGGGVFWGKSLRLPFSPEMREISAIITDEEVLERRKMRTDNDTASTSSLALTDME